MKNSIKSITGVITNSSDEVFILKTDLTLSEVSRRLSEITEGYRDPEIITKDSEILKELVDFGYLVDPGSPRSLLEYRVSELQRDCEIDQETWEDIPIPGADTYCPAWLDFLWENREWVNQEARRVMAEFIGRPWDHDLIDERSREHLYSVWEHGVSEEVLRKFLESYHGPLPETWNPSPEKLADTYIGQVGFQSTEENSIPYETWETIYESFGDVNNWHLG